MNDYPKIEQLTEKQRIFCERYCTHWNATRAAKEAGYSEDTAYNIGWENVRKRECADYIQYIKDHAFEYANVSMLRIVQELAKVAFASGADLRSAWDSMEDWENLPDEVKATISEVVVSSRVLRTIESGSETVLSETIDSIKVKQYDKLKAIEILNRMAGYNAPDKLDHTTGGEKLPQTIIKFTGDSENGDTDTSEIPAALDS